MGDTVTNENGGTDGPYGFVDTSLKTVKSVSDTVLPIWSAYLQAEQQKDQLKNETYQGDPSSQNLNSPSTGSPRQSETDDKTMQYLLIGGGVLVGAVVLIAVLK